MKTIDEMIAVMTAFKNGERIEWNRNDMGWKETKLPVFDWGSNDYRIAKPEPKTITYHAFEFSDGGLTWSRVGSDSHQGRMANVMKRVPELDKEITLP